MLKILSPRVFAIVVLISMVAGTAALTVLIKNARKKFPAALSAQELDPDRRKRLERSIRSMKVYIALLVFCLIYGLWTTRNETDPLWPRFVGVAINLGLTATFIKAVRNAQKRLASSVPATSPAPSQSQPPPAAP
jgi:hypothetical protein